MKPSAVPKFILYFGGYSLLCLAEKVLGVAGFAVGFLFAALYCREKPCMSLPGFIGAELLIKFSVNNLIFTGTTVGIYLIIALIHWKKPLKFTAAETCSEVMLTQIPVMAFTGETAFDVAITAASVLLAEGFHALSVLALYPLLVRGPRYRINGNERFAMGLSLAVMSAGIATVEPFGINVFMFLFPLALTLCRGLQPASVPALSIALGIGGSVGAGNLDFLAYSALTGIVVYGTASYNSFITAVLAGFSYALTRFCFNATVSWQAVVPVFAGGLLGAAVPRKVFERINSFRQGYRDKFALRSIVNRDRRAVADKLNGIADAFSEMRDMLSEENPDGETLKSVVGEILTEGCGNCRRYPQCRKNMDDMESDVEKLVDSAADNGKATILDATVELGENCTRLNYLLNVTNDAVGKFKKRRERRSGLEQGKEMVTTELGGISRLIRETAAAVDTAITYDTAPETELMEKLNSANVIISDVMVYGKEDREVTLVARESDVDKPQIRAVVSEVMGRNMSEERRQKDIKGMVSLFYGPAPVYGVLCGESVRSEEERCGDTRKAVKIGRNKLMFVLSDGMGTGINAYRTANRIILLIEAFYKAGLDHGTIFSCVSKLLALRNKEDFGALDVAVVDTQTGDIDFIKQGGRESYVYSGGELDVIEGGSLPIGIVADCEPKIERRKLRVGDVVVMMSDGVADNIGADKFLEIASSAVSLNPKELSDEILKDAERLSRRGDDMTVIAIRLVKAAE